MSLVASRKLRSPLKTHGGKSYLARRIIAYFPHHRTYLEPFIGGASVLLNKTPAEHEIAGDLNPRLVEFWHDLSIYPEALLWSMRHVEYTEFFFRAAKAFRCDDPDRGAFEPSVAFLVQNRFSRGGLGRDFAWSDRLRGGQPGDANAWQTIRQELPVIADRIANVDFRCVPALTLIDAHDRPGTLIYADPPYLPSTRSVPKAYAHEMTREQHVELLDRLKACKGSVILSGYRSDLYDSALAGWRRVEFDMPNHSGQGASKQRRTECLWLNFTPEG